jgi:hypothetical protein
LKTWKARPCLAIITLASEQRLNLLSADPSLREKHFANIAMFFDVHVFDSIRSDIVLVL